MKARMKLPRHWPLVLIAFPAAVAIWSGWVGLGGLCGFGPVNLLPGIAGGFHLNTAITLPVGVEAYGAYAMWAWLARKGDKATQEFARNSALAALGLGCLGQIAFHLMAAAHWDAAPWLVTMFVACIPVATFGFAVALTHKLRATPDAEPEPDVETVQDAVPDMPPDELARHAWLRSAASGEPLPVREMVRRFGRSRTYWPPRIAEWQRKAAA